MLGHYRLNKYLISEVGGNEVLWETHSGFMASLHGRGRVIGEVLFIGPPSQEKPGTFAGDFIDRLRGLPLWERTGFYCERANLCRCDQCRRLQWDEIAALPAGKSLDHRPRAATAPQRAAVSYRLCRYEIIRGPDQALQWKGGLASRSIQQGKAFVLSDILFLEPGRQKPHKLRREQYKTRLQGLPPWQETAYFATQAVVRRCRAPLEAGPSKRRSAPSRGAPVFGRALYEGLRLAGRKLIDLAARGWERMPTRRKPRS